MRLLQFFANSGQEFYERGVMKLPLKWQQTTEQIYIWSKSKYHWWQNSTDISWDITQLLLLKFIKSILDIWLTSIAFHQNLAYMRVNMLAHMIYTILSCGTVKLKAKKFSYFYKYPPPYSSDKINCIIRNFQWIFHDVNFHVAWVAFGWSKFGDCTFIQFLNLAGQESDWSSFQRLYLKYCLGFRIILLEHLKLPIDYLWSFLFAQKNIDFLKYYKIAYNT